jgi:subtilase family serine protease
MHGSIKAAFFCVLACSLVACGAHGSATLPPQLAPTESIAGRLSDSSSFTYYVKPLVRKFAIGSHVTPHVPTPSFCIANYGFACYTPDEIRTAYNVPSTLTGAGQTIAVIEAYGSPTIETDLQTFDSIMNLPGATLRVFYPQGQPEVLDSGWATETSLDVEWAHAIAPAARIDLVIAPSSSSSDMHAAEDYAVANHLGGIVTMSFGALEPSIPGGAHNHLLQHADSLFQRARVEHITMIASAGDLGATDGSGTSPVAVFPASDPLVTAVGGTSLFTSDRGAYRNETVWNDSIASLCPFECRAGIMPYATGGAPSAIFKTPSYQRGVFGATSRDVADVSYNAGIYTAVLAYMSFNGPGSAGLYFVGGTSCGAPQWAGIVALANQAAGRELGFINPRLYNIARGPAYHLAFHDITVGNDGLLGAASESARPGYDMPTGLGSPNVRNLIAELVHAQD